MILIKGYLIGFKQGEKSDISSMYNLRCDPNLVDEKATVNKILGVCIKCIEQLETT